MAFINRCCGHTPATAAGPQQAQQAQPSQQPSQQPPDFHDPAVPSNTNGMMQMTGSQTEVMSTHTSDPQMVEGQTGSVADPQTCSMSHQSPSKKEEDAASPSVHFFMMGDQAHRGWKACHSWPPPSASTPPLKLFLNKGPGPAAKAIKSWFSRNRTSAQVTGEEDVASQVHKSCRTIYAYTERRAWFWQQAVEQGSRHSTGMGPCLQYYVCSLSSLCSLSLCSLLHILLCIQWSVPADHASELSCALAFASTADTQRYLCL